MCGLQAESGCCICKKKNRVLSLCSWPIRQEKPHAGRLNHPSLLTISHLAAALPVTYARKQTCCAVSKWIQPLFPVKSYFDSVLPKFILSPAPRPPHTAPLCLLHNDKCSELNRKGNPRSGYGIHLVWLVFVLIGLYFTAPRHLLELHLRLLGRCLLIVRRSIKISLGCRLFSGSKASRVIGLTFTGVPPPLLEMGSPFSVRWPMEVVGMCNRQELISLTALKAFQCQRTWKVYFEAACKNARSSDVITNWG